MPAAPAWPDPVTEDERRAVAEPPPERPREPSPPIGDEPEAWRNERGQVTMTSPQVADAQPPPASPAHPAPTHPPAARGAGQSAVNLPITWPVTLSGWLIGVGALLAVVGVVVGLVRGAALPLDLVIALALLGIAATVFFAANLPAIAHLRLVTLGTAFIGVGIGLDRLMVGFADVGDLLLLLGTAAAAVGGALVEIGRDQPLGGG